MADEMKKVMSKMKKGKAAGLRGYQLKQWKNMQIPLYKEKGDIKNVPATET